MSYGLHDVCTQISAKVGLMFLLIKHHAGCMSLHSTLTKSDDFYVSYVQDDTYLSTLLVVTICKGSTQTMHFGERVYN